jgi:hypothetical protein
MDDIVASNVPPPPRRLPSVPWPWAMFAGFLFASFILLGIAGIFLSVYGEYITYSNIPFYVQGVNTILSVFLSLAETGLLVSTIKWVEVMKHEQENLRRSYNLPNLSNNNEFTYCHIVFLGIAMLGMNIGLIISEYAFFVYNYNSYISLFHYFHSVLEFNNSL